MSYVQSGAVGRSGANWGRPTPGCWVLTGAAWGVRLALEPTPPAPPHPTRIAPGIKTREWGDSSEG
jgi:hypothetical protein